MSTPNQIGIAGERFSTNLGDGVIAESLAHIISITQPGIPTRFIDISGHDDWHPSSPDRNKSAAKSPRLSLPRRIDNKLRWHLVRKSRCQTAWRSHLEQITRLIVGGGQLLMDNDLDFPYKVQAIVEEAAHKEIPVHFVACGVNPNWSRRAARLFKEALDHAETVSVRDVDSAASLHALIPTSNPKVVFDPAIWAADLYGYGPGQVETHKIGLGVIDLKSANRRSQVSLAEEEYIAKWQSIIHSFAKQGKDIELFTNGNPQDYRTALKIAEHMKATYSITCLVAKRPTRPYELAHQIAGYSDIIAARLHACIIATSYRIPVVGLSWDKKVNSFFEAIGKSSLAINLAEVTPGGIHLALEEARAYGLNQSKLNEFRASASQAISSVLSTKS